MNMGSELFTTNVGSHMWKMETPESDMDLFQCFRAPSYDILRGVADIKSQHILVETDEDGHPLAGSSDIARHEVGKVVEMFIAGNVNFLWGVFSPIIVADSGWLQSLRPRAEDVLSRKCANSILGLAKANRKKYIESGKDPSPKRFQLIARTLNFGQNLMRKGLPIFDSVYVETIQDLIGFEEDLRFAANESILPDEPPPKAVDALRHWLLSVRMNDMAPLGWG